MNEVDRYLKRATRGLWGQKRRDAQAELRGAVEDKVYLCRLQGQSEAQAWPQRYAIWEIHRPLHRN